jgi:transposase
MESFIRYLENAFHYFGGVTVSAVIDNLKAGVIQADRLGRKSETRLGIRCLT